MTTPTVPGRPALHGPGLTDVRMMLVAHRNFRRELGLTPEDVRASVGHPARARAVAEHVALFLDLLEHHHTIEDELLWAPLLERVPAELAPLVHLMEGQHHAVADLLAGARTAVQTWRDGDVAAGADVLADALADALAALCTALFEHLDAEEEHVLPLMARHVTAAEWDRFTEAGMSVIPPGMRAVGFGMLLYEGDPAAMAGQLQALPRPVRLLLPHLGRRAYRRYARAVHGTPAPPCGVGTGPR